MSSNTGTVLDIRWVIFKFILCEIELLFERNENGKWKRARGHLKFSMRFI